jgi:beta-lactamase class A
MTTRRDFLAGSAAAGFTLAGAPVALAAGSESRALIGEFRRIEREVHGRLGVSVLYTASDRQFGFRSLERFPMCSTFKLLAAALVLRRVDQGKERLDRHVAIRPSDIISYSPVAENASATT